MPYDSRINPTTIYLPGQGFGNYGQQIMGAAPTANPFMVNNPRYNPDDPNSGNEMMQDPMATGSPRATSYTASNGLTTTGIMNPFGLTQNNPAMGYYGATPPSNQPPPAPIADSAAVSPDDSSPNPVDNRPPDQRGFTGFYSDPNGPTVYNTPQGRYSMDPFGNWTDIAGSPVDFDQSGFPPPAPTGPGGLNFSQQRREAQYRDIGVQTDGKGNALPDSLSQYYVRQQAESPITGAEVPPAGAVPPTRPGSVTRNGALTGGRTTPAPTTYNVNGRIVRAGAEEPPQTPIGQTPQTNTGAAAVTQPAGAASNAAFNPQYLGDVTSSSIDPKTGRLRYDPTNPYQFATPGTAGDLASRYGLNQYGVNLSGPGMGYSQDMQMLGPGYNAGLAARSLARKEYGSGAPGSYGEYASGLTGDTQGIGYDAWARSRPGFTENPRLANTGPGVGNQYQKALPQQQAAAPPVMSFEQWQAAQGQQQYQQPQYQQPQQQYQQQGPSWGGGRQYPQNNYGGGQGRGTYGGYGRQATGSWGYGGGNTRQQPQQGGYTPGQKSSQYNPYGQTYMGYGTPATSTPAKRPGGYLHTNIP